MTMNYRRCGRSGLLLPAVSLGLWHNFGDADDPAEARLLLRAAFDAGITHFDLANNYGPPPGSAERNFGRILRQDFAGHRDHLVISTKAGHLMWDGPYGEWGSRKHLLASLDQSLARLGLDHVDIFYSHRPDPDTPLEETMDALATAVRQGKALYAGISKYPGPRSAEAAGLLRAAGAPCLIHQPPFSLLNRWPEANGLPPVLDQLGIGCIAFSPLAQGMLTGKYLERIPEGSRAARPEGFLQTGQVAENLPKLQAFAALAAERGEPLAVMALAWVLRHPWVTSALIGARDRRQLAENLAALRSPPFTSDHLARLDAISAGQAWEA
jgi:L-glyceraldehyde 3-phosphate reductase